MRFVGDTRVENLEQFRRLYDDLQQSGTPPLMLNVKRRDSSRFVLLKPSGLKGEGRLMHTRNVIVGVALWCGVQSAAAGPRDTYERHRGSIVAVTYYVETRFMQQTREVEGRDIGVLVDGNLVMVNGVIVSSSSTGAMPHGFRVHFDGGEIRAASLVGRDDFANIGFLRLDGDLRALAAGLRLVQVREKTLAPDARDAFIGEVMRRAHAHGARVLLNGEPGLARDLGAEGVHLSAAELMRCRERPALAWCAASCHDAAELAQAAALGLDFVVLGSVLPTASHPGGLTLGWERFAALVADTPLPVYALGGLAPADLGQAWRCGAHGFAMMRGAWPD